MLNFHWAKAHALVIGFLGGLLLAIPVATGQPVTVVARSATATPSVTATASPQNLWLMQSNRITQLAADTAQILQVLPVSNTHTSAVDPTTGTLWYVDDSGIQAVDIDGDPHFPEPISRPDDEQPLGLVVDHENALFWLVTRGNAYRYSITGTLLNSISMPGITSPPALLSSGEIALLVNHELARLSPTGALIAKTRLPIKNPRILHANETSDSLWIIGKESVLRFGAENEVSTWAHSLPNPDLIDDDGRNGIWLADKHSVVHFDVSGTETFRVRASKLPGSGNGPIRALAADPRDGNIWFAQNHSAHKLTNAGKLAASVSLGVNGGIVRDGRLHIDRTPPEIWITSPEEGARTNIVRPALSAHYTDIGSRVVPESLQFSLNGENLATECESNANDAACLPVSPLHDGEHEIAARIEDLAGNVGTTDARHFTVDTTPPSIIVQSPSSGTITNQYSLPLIGHLDEAATLTLDGELLNLDGEFRFSTSVELEYEGENTFSLHAEDLAGNTSSKNVVVVRDTVPPLPVIADQITIEPLPDGSIRITGSPGAAEPGSMLRIVDIANGVTVTVAVNADGSFDAVLPAGNNGPFEITVIDQAGNESPASTVELPGGNPGIPPDPTTIAPPLSQTAFTPFHEATSFLYSGANRIQFDVDPETIEPRRVVVLRGKVMTRNGEPLSGAKVTINNHPEYGYTVSRADGAYDLAVNGGGYATVNIEKENFLPSQRTVKTPWRDYVIVENMALVELDPAVTTVDLAALTDIAVAQGSVVLDEDGERQATILVPPGTAASMTLPDGTQQALSTINVRATEYTVGPNGPEPYTRLKEDGQDE